MTHTPEELAMARRMLDLLGTFPADGQLRSDLFDPLTVTEAISCSLIERVVIEKPCKTCGTRRHDYSFFRITAAGRYFLAATHLKGNPHGEG